LEGKERTYFIFTGIIGEGKFLGFSKRKVWLKFNLTLKAFITLKEGIGLISLKKLF